MAAPERQPPRFLQDRRYANGMIHSDGVGKSLRQKAWTPLPCRWAKPPVYPLEKIRAPVALFRGLADIGTHPRDYEDFRQRLRHVLVADYTVPDPKFTHLDFLFNFNATEILHVPMMNLMRNYTTSDT